MKNSEFISRTLDRLSVSGLLASTSLLLASVALVLCVANDVATKATTESSSRLSAPTELDTPRMDRSPVEPEELPPHPLLSSRNRVLYALFDWDPKRYRQ